MKTFSQFLEETKKLMGDDVISLYHHPIHGTHLAHGYAKHDEIRKKVGSRGDDTKFQHTGYAEKEYGKSNTIQISHYKKPKQEHKSEFESKLKKHYKLGRNPKFKHIDAYGKNENF